MFSATTTEATRTFGKLDTEFLQQHCADCHSGDAPEGDGTLPDHSMIPYGSGNSDGNRHSHDNLPVLLAGSGTITPGRHICLSRETALSNLWLSMLNRMDVDVTKLGDSSGELSGLQHGP